jgi:hypothetical protein
VPAPGDYDGGEIGGMTGRGIRSTRRKPAPVPLCPPQTPHVARMRTRAAAVGSSRNVNSYSVVIIFMHYLDTKVAYGFQNLRKINLRINHITN